jgi:hypothetical protein
MGWSAGADASMASKLALTVKRVDESAMISICAEKNQAFLRQQKKRAIFSGNFFNQQKTGQFLSSDKPM